MSESGGITGTGGTSGAPLGTDGLIARYEARALVAIIALSLINNLVNIATILSDRAELGMPAIAWRVWLDEVSSWVGLACMLPLARRSARGFRPPRLPWAAAPLAHLPVAMLFSGGHVAIMLAIRQLGWATMGQRYDFFGDSPAGTLLYEFRKDILFYTAAVLVLLLVRALAESRSTPVPAASARIEIRDRGRTIWLRPDEVVSAEAAANYVELHTQSGPILHRATLAGIEAQLGPAFARIHRSRLVRRDAIREMRTTPAGDFEVILTDGRTLAGSRRYRAGLQA